MVIVVGVDETPQGYAALRRALAEAERWGAQLHVVHVVDLALAYGAAWEGVMPYQDLADSERERVWQSVAPLVEEARVPVERVDLQGYPPDSLVRYAEKVGAELLVVGSRGRGELASMLLGSTSHRVAHIAPCDVLIVKEAAGERR